jgi:hypothetical protein
VSGGLLSINGISSNKIVLQGKKAEINKRLENLKYEPIKDSNKSERLTVNAFDGKFGSIIRSKINIIPINDAPLISSDNKVFSKENFVVWPEPIFSDVDSKYIVVSLEARNGKVQIDNLETKQVKGSLSEVNKLFASYGRIKILPNDGKETQLNLIVSDGSKSSSKNIVILEKEDLSENATNAVLSRLQNASNSIFSVMDHNNSIYTRNTNAWVNDLNLTSISPWNSAGSNRMAGTLISPKHIVYATHYQMPIGSKIRFVTKDNIVVERTLINKISPRYEEVYFPDITVGVLDSEVPSSIGFAKILPSNWNEYLLQSNDAPGLLKNQIPCLGIDQEEKALVTGLSLLTNRAIFNPLNKEPYTTFYENIIAGDSGNPAFMIINNELVLITIWTFGYGGSGTFLTAQKNAINQIMNELGGGYQLTEIDLSSFKKITV